MRDELELFFDMNKLKDVPARPDLIWDRTSLEDRMRVDQVDTLIDQLEDFIKAVVNVHQDPNSAANHVVHSNMRESLKEYISDLVGITKEPEEYKCPDCGSKMLQRKNKQSGNVFYGCSKFPDCRGTRDENGLSKEDRAAQKDKEEEYSQQEGYSFSKKRWNETGPTNG